MCLMWHNCDHIIDIIENNESNNFYYCNANYFEPLSSVFELSYIYMLNRIEWEKKNDLSKKMGAIITRWRNATILHIPGTSFSSKKDVV